jgi:hypothetical protein
VVRHLMAASAAVVLLVSGCSDDGSGSADEASVDEASVEEALVDDTVPRLTIDLDELIAQLEDGEVEIPPDFEPPPVNQVDTTCVSGVLNYLVTAGAIEQGDLMLWYSGVNSDDPGPVTDAVNAVIAEGDCLTN